MERILFKKIYEGDVMTTKIIGIGLLIFMITFIIDSLKR